MIDIIAHRGASHDAPENTLSAIRLAWQQGADGVEIDVHLTADGKIAVLHDADTRRTTGHKGTVAAMTFEQLRRFDAGQWKAPEYAGERIPSLQEVLELLPDDKRLMIEIKCRQDIIPALQDVLDTVENGKKKIEVISFNPAPLKKIRQSRPHWKVAWLAGYVAPGPRPGPRLGELIRRSQDAGFHGLSLHYRRLLRPSSVAKIKAAGLKVYAWTVNDPATARRLVDNGVDGLVTDRPGWLKEQLEKK